MPGIASDQTLLARLTHINARPAGAHEGGQVPLVGPCAARIGSRSKTMSITLAYLGVFFGGIGLFFLGIGVLWWVSLQRGSQATR